MIEHTLHNIADAQHANGAVPTTAPEYIYFKGKWLDPVSYTHLAKSDADGLRYGLAAFREEEEGW